MKRWLQRLRSDGDMASRNIGRPRGAEAGVCVMSLHSHLSKRALFVSPRVKTGARSCRITDQRLDCSRAVLHSRQCLQTSAGPRSVLDYVSAEHWPAKQVTCG